MRSMSHLWKRILSGAWVLNDTEWAHHQLPKTQSSQALIAQILIRYDKTRVKDIHSFMRTNMYSSMK